MVNPKTGKAERVFVNLEAVYPNPNEPTLEFSFEELRAINRGWAGRDWRTRPASPVGTTLISSQPSPAQSAAAHEKQVDELGLQVHQHLVLDEENSSQLQDVGQQLEAKKAKSTKARRVKVREIKQEAQTGELIPLVCWWQN